MFKSDLTQSILISTLCLLMNLEIFVEYLVYRTEEQTEDLIFFTAKSHYIAHVYLGFCWFFIGDRGI